MHLFDHLVGERQQGRRYGYAERFGDLSTLGEPICVTIGEIPRTFTPNECANYF
jgi:hypothetical protein